MGLYRRARFRLAGDRGLLVEYGDVIDPVINRKVRSMAAAIEQQAPEGVVEVIPTYRSLLILYDPFLTNPHELEEVLLRLEGRLQEIEIPPPKTVEIPVCYGGEFGPDLDFVARSHGLEPEEVIRLHSEPVYQVYMIGFTPGFPFLGGLPKALYTPRRETPRKKVPAGSVGIANDQTGIYPIESPGGWQLIGRTPLKIFDPKRSDPFLLGVGDLLKFRPISPEEYRRLAEGKE
ncbi:MAG: allophanate hydrolase subunit 1 [Deltaproteobacteria bacterium]|nr:MAG: allophanate hydrolase subunit 1 [Deltaproteobacteria bacterium]